MGGCCFTAKGPELTAAAGNNNHSTISEEQVPLAIHHETTTDLSPGLLVDTNLDTSDPDTYRSPPAPVPYNVSLGYPQTAAEADKATGDKSDETGKIPLSGSTERTAADDNNTQDNSVKCEDLKLSDCKPQPDCNIENEKDLASDPLKSVERLNSAEECPTCLEEYDDDNPKIITKCEHNFHLACILEWLERSDTCPVCGQEMELDLDPPIS